MSAVSSPLCWVRVVFPILEDDFFFFSFLKVAFSCFGFFYLEISAISHEKIKKEITEY